MYKKLLFLTIATTLFHGTIYSMDIYGSNKDYGEISLNTKLKSVSTSAKLSFVQTATCGTALATILFLAKDRSTDNKTVLPLLTAIMVATGISAITSALSQGFGLIADSKGWKKLGNLFAGTENMRTLNTAKSWSPCIGVFFGSIAGIYYYQTQ